MSGEGGGGGGYELVRLRGGRQGVRSQRYGEVCHPGVGPMEEAERVYVGGLGLRRRWREGWGGGPFVVWDVGLGGGANAVAAMRAAVEEGIELDLRVVSFDWGAEPLRFALGHSGELGYFGGFERWCRRLAEEREVVFEEGEVRVRWTLEAGDFAGRMRGGGDGDRDGDRDGDLPSPHAVLYDPHSPRVNPEMWTLPVFRGLYGRLDAGRGCGLATYTRSTAVRVGMLLAGFWVGVGEGTETKEETTLAANRGELAGRLLDGRWLERVRRSGAAEPWEGPPYEGRPLGEGTWERLAGCRQFAGKPGASHGGR